MNHCVKNLLCVLGVILFEPAFLVYSQEATVLKQQEGKKQSVSEILEQYSGSMHRSIRFKVYVPARECQHLFRPFKPVGEICSGEGTLLVLCSPNNDAYVLVDMKKTRRIPLLSYSDLIADYPTFDEAIHLFWDHYRAKSGKAGKWPVVESQRDPDLATSINQEGPATNTSAGSDLPSNPETE